MINTIQIPNDWIKIEEYLYKCKDVIIDTYMHEDCGLPYTIKNPQLKQNQNIRYSSYKWEDIINYVYADDEERLRLKRIRYGS